MSFQPSFRVLVLISISILIILVWISRSYSSKILSLVQYTNCINSSKESENFICESDDIWNERKILYKAQDKLNMDKRESSIFFLSNWEPNFHCSHAHRIGQMGDGGKWVCDPFRLKLRENCLIYSAGSNGDFSFENHMKKTLPNCEIHTFDTNLYKCPQNICIFHQVRFGDGIHPNNSKTWQMIIQELNHSRRLIDIFKIDIEGGEYGFFPTIFNASKISFPKQILVEIHPEKPEAIHRFFELLRSNNYVIFNKEPNLLAGSSYFEYTFLRLNEKFFQ